MTIQVVINWQQMLRQMTNVSKCQVQMLANVSNWQMLGNDRYNWQMIQHPTIDQWQQITQYRISFNLPPNWKNRYDKQVWGWFWVFGIFFYEFSNKFYLKTYNIFNWNIDNFYDDDEIEIDVDDDEFEL